MNDAEVQTTNTLTQTMTTDKPAKTDYDAEQTPQRLKNSKTVVYRT